MVFFCSCRVARGYHCLQPLGVSRVIRMLPCPVTTLDVLFVGHVPGASDRHNRPTEEMEDD